MSDKYILGGGLSGLVAAYYNPEYTVIAPEYGGFVDTKFGRAFVVLHETPAMVELFDEVGVPSFSKRIEIAYYEPDAGVTTELHGSQEQEFARRYVEEKLPPDYQPGKDLELSAPGDSWRALFVDSSIISALSDYVQDRKAGFVEDIREDEITVKPQVGQKEDVEWDRIISTLPATLFRKLVDADWDLEHEPTTLAELPRDKVPDRYFTKPWNILYAVDPAVEYHRVVRNMLSTRYYVECLGDVDVYGALDSVTNPNGVIQDEALEAPFPGIRFLGRYAEWDHEVRIDHVIEEAKQGL